MATKSNRAVLNAPADAPLEVTEVTEEAQGKTTQYALENGAKYYHCSEVEDSRSNKTFLPLALPPDELVEVFISSRNKEIHEKKINGRARKFITGKISGTQPHPEGETDKDGKVKEISFTQDLGVECDRLVTVPFYVAQHFRDYI